MGIYDRDYTQAGHDAGRPLIRYGMPPLTPAVKWLLIVNVAIFLFEAISGQMEQGNFNHFEYWGAVSTQSWISVAQLWRLVTYQFLHHDTKHVVLNMLCLFALGPRLEGRLGTRRFTVFYLLCGIIAAVCYIIMAMAAVVSKGVLVGASGAVLGVLAAVAVFFPYDKVIFLIFPMSVRLAAILMIIISLATGLAGYNVGGEIAHIGGIAAGAAYAWLGPKLNLMLTARKRSAWDQKMERQRRLQIEVDRLLDKVHEHGLASLTRHEKKLLQEATRLEQERRRNIEIGR